MTQPLRPFADTVVAYVHAGWPCIIPVPPVEKHPPPVGYTGEAGADTDPLTLVQWAGTHAEHSIALRLPSYDTWCVIGIDVDQYAKTSQDAAGVSRTVEKRGAETLAAFEQLWGALPPTWSSTARGSAEGPGPSRIMLFRAPAQRYGTRLASTESGTGDIEIIQRHHRYAVVWPSIHSWSGGQPRQYVWYDPAGVPVGQPPKPDELPWLPAEWVTGLHAMATQAGPVAAGVGDGQRLLSQLEADTRTECADITSARLRGLTELQRADAGTRHDIMAERTHHLVQMAAAGHPGVAAALAELRAVWADLTAGEGREEEFERALLTSARKAVTQYGAAQVDRDPCLTYGGFTVPALAPGDPTYRRPSDPDDLEPIVEPPRWGSVREVIGAHAFDPRAELDQPLAERVLERVYPALRYAYDSGGWLLRVPDRWELHKRLSPWAVAQVAKLMPLGDPTAEKGSDEHARSARRARLMSTAGARAVAGKMDDLVCGGMHPAAVALAQLDADGEVLWAGGMPYDLRTSLAGPALAAHVDPSTPHLHSAAVVPQPGPTPLWDAFLAAVWPDESVRRWALRVLSIAFTGYADRALPILLGETGRGKTQVVTLLMSVLGTYAHGANSKLLSAASNEHDTIVFALKGRRLSFIDEAPSEAKAGQERLKQLTGGGELEARQMNQDPITFTPSHTLVLTSNDPPLLTDAAVRSRTRLIPCEGDPEQVWQARKAIGRLSSPGWRREAPGVLAAMMAEAAGWLHDPTTAHVAAAPEHIRYLAENIGAGQDPTAVWVTEECEPWEPGTGSRELYQAFTASCLRNNLRRDQIPSENRWARTLTQLGFPATRTNNGSRRQLRVRPLGWGTDFPAPSGGGSVTHCDALVTHSDPNASPTFPQVSREVSPVSDASDAFLDTPTHTCAPTRTREPGVENAENASHASPTPRGDTGRSADPPLSEAKQRAKDLAAQKRATASAEKRQAAVAAAAGHTVPLPALVMADSLTPIGLEDAHALLDSITATDQALTVDVEHTGYPIGHRDYALRTVQLGKEHFAVVLDATDPAQADVVRRHLATASALHAHSATADVVPLTVAGLVDADEAWSKMFDTVIPAKLADPASTGANDDLKGLATAVLGEQATSKAADEARAALFKAGKWLTDTKATTPVEKSGWAQSDPTCATMVRYAGSDVLDDAALARRLPWPEPNLLERERTVQRMTARVALHGLRIDPGQVTRLLGEQREALADAGGRLRAFGIENPGSDAQIGTRAAELGAQLPRTATGKLSVAKGALDQYRRLDGVLGDFVRARLDYQKAETALGLFLEPYKLLVEHGDGRARPTVYTLSADTGRMSCVRPNLQQVPREGGFRACLTADPGELLISADFAAVEIRVMAALSQDANLIRMLREGVDLHWVIARQVFGPDATKSDRYDVKRGVFGWAYGGSVPTLARQVGASEQVMGAVVDTLASIAPTYVQWATDLKHNVRRGFTRFPTYAGRIVHLPRAFPHKAPNYAIQGTARELLVDALARWERTPWGRAVMLPVHDEIVGKVREAEAPAATEALVECMTTEVYGVPIVAEASEPSFAWKDAA